MGDFFVMCGIPRSGKSTVANAIAGKSAGNAVVVSSDAMREKFFGDESILYDKAILQDLYDARNNKTGNEEVDWKAVGNAFVFKKMNAMSRSALRCGKDVIYDATSITEKDRKMALSAVKGLYNKAYIVYVPCELTTALQRNSLCKRVVPEEVIYRMNDRLEVPGDYEVDPDVLFDGIITINM